MNGDIRNLTIRAFNEEALVLNEEEIQQHGANGVVYEFLGNCCINMDFDGGQIQADISLFTHNAFMVKKLRIKDGKI